MNGVTEIVETDRSAGALDWASEVLQQRLADVIVWRDKALDADAAEGVHQMRVAIRRLRSALRDFSPLLKSRALKEPKHSLRYLAEKLGEARDQDVALAALERLQAKAKSEKVKNEITAKIEKRRAVRRKTQDQLEKILDISALEELRERFARALEETVDGNKKYSALTARDAGRRIILKSLDEFCVLSISLYDPFNQKELHKLRIAAKRLRYAIELFSSFWGERIIPFAKAVGQMQTFLGEVHDCDIWLENLTARLRTEKKAKQLADFWLLSRFTRDRTKNYRAALRLWSKWEKDDFVKKLRKVLQQKTIVAKELTPAETTETH